MHPAYPDLFTVGELKVTAYRKGQTSSLVILCDLEVLRKVGIEVILPEEV